MPSLALFDLDNTLLDRSRAFSRWTTAFVAARDLPRGAELFIESADEDGMRPRDEFFTSLQREFDLAESVDELLSEYHEEYPRCFAVDRETLDAIRRLRSGGWKVGVVTNGPPSQLLKLRVTEFEREFDAVCVSSLVGATKPERGIFEAAARVCGVPLAGWMVGDAPEADIEGGRRAGLTTIWMSRGRQWDSAFAPPDHVVATVPAAVGIILASEVRPTRS